MLNGLYFVIFLTSRYLGREGIWCSEVPNAFLQAEQVKPKIGGNHPRDKVQSDSFLLGIEVLQKQPNLFCFKDEGE